MADAIMTSGGLAYVRDMLAAASAGEGPQPPLYIVLASGTNPVGRFWTTLPGETFRSPIVARDAVGNAVTYHAWLSVTDNTNQTIGSYGLFGGAATLTKNTGTLVAVSNEANPFSKQSTQTLSVDLVLTMSGTVG